jgi:fructokinase
MDVLCFGEALVDFFPERPGIPLEDCERFERHLGGAPCNVAVGLARLGVRVGLQTRVGRDAFGTFVTRRLAEEGVDVSRIRVDPSAKTGVTFVAVAADGGRSFLFFRHPSADQCVPVDDVDPTTIVAARVLHVGSSTLAKEPARAATWRAIAAARAAGRIVSCDPNWRAHLWEGESASELHRLLAVSDVLKISDDECVPILGAAVPDEDGAFLDAADTVRQRSGAALVTLTRGPKGCVWSTANGHGVERGTPVRAVDSTGAGDAFVAGLWSALLPYVNSRADLASLAPEQVGSACRTANAEGARAVTHLGALGPRV